MIQQILLRSRYLQILLLLTVIGAALRFYSLGESSLWLDEALTYRFSLHPFGEYWGLISSGGEVHPPLFYWFTHFTLGFGHNEAVLRFLPALFGVLAIPAVYLLGSVAVDRNAGILGAALITFSPFHLFYSQEARMYTMLMLFLILALFFFLRARGEGRTTDWILFGVFSALAFWTHFFSAVLIAAAFFWQGVKIIRSGQGRISGARNFILAFFCFIVLALPVILVSWPILLSRTADRPTWGDRGFEVLSSTLYQFGGYSEIVAAILCGLFLLGMYMLWRARKENFFLIAWIFCAVLGAGIILSFLMPMAPRYFAGILPLFFVGIASSYLLLTRVKPGPRIVYLFLLALVLISLPGVIGHYTEEKKENWRDFSTLIEQSTAPGDTVVIMPSYISEPFDFYYRNATDGTRELALSSEESLKDIFAEKGTGRIFIAFTDDLNAADPSGRAIEWIKTHGQFAGKQEGVYVFVVP
ncbi:MAG: glycosyltransferase family 39 protein [Methanolinea sp.]|nr:glycosyltransferase family 39 protein [Methanolinea sp.]